MHNVDLFDKAALVAVEMVQSRGAAVAQTREVTDQQTNEICSFFCTFK